MQELKTKMAAHASLVEVALDEYLSEIAQVGEIARPLRLIEAMRHGALNGGKRLRPFLVFEAAALFGVPSRLALVSACAVECVHCYSLIHDDLPAMDDDDLRRGQPTVHRAFDDATAILAGDSLLTLAFDLLASNDCHADPAVRIELVSLLAKAAGLGGMAGGQMLDLQAEASKADAEAIRLLQSMKTGALIRVSCEMGAVLGGAGPMERDALVRYGLSIGEAFQLADDILDQTASSETVGKKTGKDAAAGKGTLVALNGITAARAAASLLVEKAEDALDIFGERASLLRDCARFIVERQR